MKSRSMLCATVLLAMTLPLSAIAAEDMSKAGAMGDMKMDSVSAMSSGEVRKVDKDAGKVTIKHGPLANLDMPGMTMVFRVKDPAMLDQVKAGDQIHFVAEKVGGALTVTKIEAAK